VESHVNNNTIITFLQSNIELIVAIAPHRQ